jgi:hypothetical protein
MDTHDPELAARANSLYWESDAGVNEIAERLDLSKGALYGLIEPLDAGLDCPECSGSMEYPNRTALDKSTVTCSRCGLEEEFALVEAAALDVHDPTSPRADGLAPQALSAQPASGGSDSATHGTSVAPAASQPGAVGRPRPRHSTRAGELADGTVPVRTLVASTFLALAAGIAIGQIAGRR